jgi:hypothetical protein
VTKSRDEAHLARAGGDQRLRGTKRRAKTDWADARGLRELLLIGRLPESWIAPAHLLDLRAHVRCRHTLVEQRTDRTGDDRRDRGSRLARR